MKKPNILFLGVDSMRRDHMSMYGYKHLTTPHLDKLMSKGTVFENMFSPSIPTTPGYASMLTGRDCFGTDVVALGHKGPMDEEAKPIATILGEQGYNTTCVGFKGNAASAGFQNYIEFSGWGSWDEGRSPKAENLNEVAIPELKRLMAEDKPYFLFLRHMDPHAPYLPPQPYEKTFYGGDEKDPNNKSLEPVMAFKPFCDFYADWFNPEATDKDYVIAQYDGELAYMDACIQKITQILEDAGELDNTLIVLTSDHGETLYDHDCYFDHHGLYDCTLTVPLAFRWPGVVPQGKRVSKAYVQEKDIVPTMLDMIGIKNKAKMDGRSLVPEMNGTADPATNEPEMYLTECTWMHKHGWRTPEWKFIWALEPDFHFKPQFELYNLLTDPEEYNNLADKMPEMVELFKNKILDHIKKRTKAVKKPEAPIYRNFMRDGKPFESSQEAYDKLHIGGVGSAMRLQQKK